MGKGIVSIYNTYHAKIITTFHLGMCGNIHTP